MSDYPLVNTDNTSKIPYLVGFHVGGGLETFKEKLPLMYKEGYRLFQIFLSSPRSLGFPDLKKLKKFLEIAPPGTTFIVHGPFCISLVSDPVGRVWQNTLRYYINASAACEYLGIRNIVTHIGSVSNGQGKKSGFYNLVNFCYKWLERTHGHKTILNLENSAGSKNGRRIGSVALLYNAVKMIDHPRIRLCFDVEHAYANGFDIDDDAKIDKVLEYTNVVHLNAIPENVVKGGHLDRHSYTLIKESKNGPDEIVNIGKKAFLRNIPIILERRGDHILVEDFSYLADIFVNL